MDWTWKPSGKIVTVKHVRQLVRTAEEEFTWCWRVLAELKYEVPKPAGLTDIVALQPRLAKALFALEHCYQQLKQQDRAMIEKKSRLKRDYVASQLSKTKALRTILNQCIDVGRVLGDSYAWLFYQREHKLLQEHQRHQQIARSTTGTGGIGEITYLENLPVVNKYLVIYHGTTTFLRLGDISMVDLQSLRVVAIGELKSHRVGPGEISITVNLIGSKLKKDLVPPSRRPDTPDHLRPITKLKPEQLDRLKRQVAAIGKAFKSSNVPRLRSENLCIEWNIEKLSRLAQVSNAAHFHCVKVDRGLLLVGLRLRNSTLWSTLADGPKSKVAAKLEGMEKSAREIVDRSLPDNSLTIGWLLYGAAGRYNLMAGMRPIVWWPLEREVVEALIFRRLLVMTLFNPAFVINELRTSGFSVKCDRGARLTVTKPFRGTLLGFAGFEYFLRMIQRYLLPEAAVIRMLENCVSALESKSFPMPAIIDLQYNFEFS